MSRERYKSVNAVWPSEVPKLEAKEAKTAALRLYRAHLGKKFTGKVKITSGNRYTWVRYGVLYVNPDRGWKALVHELSHLIHRRRNPGNRPHASTHTSLEREMIRYVLEKDWLSGKLKRPETTKPPVDRAARFAELVEKREAKARKMLEKWEKAQARAEKHVAKWQRVVKGYERRAARKGVVKAGVDIETAA